MNAHRIERQYFLADSHRAKLGGEASADAAGEYDRGQQRPQCAQDGHPDDSGHKLGGAVFGQ